MKTSKAILILYTLGVIIIRKSLQTKQGILIIQMFITCNYG